MIADNYCVESTLPKSGFPPIARYDAQMLILGSLPGDVSIMEMQYYAHPGNQFWKLMGSVIGRDLVHIDYRERIHSLHLARIALWDVVGEAHRLGSLDQEIRNAKLNDLGALVTSLPELCAIAFNGKKAAALGRNVLDDRRLDILCLPSSSPANTMEFRAKVLQWGVLARYVKPIA